MQTFVIQSLLLQPVEPIDDRLECQAIVPNLTGTLGMVALREQTGGHRARVLERLDLQIKMHQRNEVVLARRQKQNVLFDQRRDIGSHVGLGALKVSVRRCYSRHVHALIQAPLRDRTSAGCAFGPRIDHRRDAKFEQGFEKKALGRAHLAKRRVQSVGIDVTGHQCSTRGSNAAARITRHPPIERHASVT